MTGEMAGNDLSSKQGKNDDEIDVIMIRKYYEK